MEAHLKNKKRVFFNELPELSGAKNGASGEPPRAKKFYSQPIQIRPTTEQETSSKNTPQNPNMRKPVDRRFDSFKTWSGKLERQISHIRGKQPREAGPEDLVLHNSDVETLTVDRYYDALEGPELDTLRVI